MSDVVLHIISTDPSFLPRPERQNHVHSWLKAVFGSAPIEQTITEDIEFISQGALFEAVYCDKCGSEIDLEDWQEAMDLSGETNFKELTFIAPCCGRTTSLNDLDYRLPAGFSKYVVSVINPPGKDLDTKDLRTLEDILETRLRLIWARY